MILRSGSCLVRCNWKRDTGRDPNGCNFTWRIHLCCFFAIGFGSIPWSSTETDEASPVSCHMEIAVKFEGSSVYRHNTQRRHPPPRLRPDVVSWTCFLQTICAAAQQHTQGQSIQTQKLRADLKLESRVNRDVLHWWHNFSHPAFFTFYCFPLISPISKNSFVTHGTGSGKGILIKRYVMIVQNYKNISMLFGHPTASNWLSSAASQMWKALWRL